MNDVFVAGSGMTRFGKQPTKRLREMATEAIRGALKDADLESRAIETAFFGNAVAGSITGQEMVAGQVCLRDAGIRGIPIVNVENACASASTAFQLACQAVASGSVSVAIAVGAEKMTHPDKAFALSVIGRAADVEEQQHTDTDVKQSYFMGVYAREARRYMEMSGATAEDFALVTVKNQRQGALNELAQYGSDVAVNDVLASREIAWPLTLLMCSPISDGAAAAIVTRDVRGSNRPLVKVVASQLASGGDPTINVTRKVAQAAYEEAGLGPEDLDVVEVHDATASAELSIYEDLSLASPGLGVELIRQNVTSLGGAMPVNTSGGLLARGHPIGATGLGQIHEILMQLRGRGGARQVEGARVGLAQNAGGWLDNDHAAAAIHIFECAGA